MPPASVAREPRVSSGLCLADLLRIRHENVDTLRDRKDYLGSAVGFKYSERTGRFLRDERGELVPAILVFVRRKTAKPEKPVPAVLSTKDGRCCATDVVSGTLSTGQVKPVSPKDPGLAALRGRLEQDKRIGGGMPIVNAGARGTAACVVRKAKDTRNYILTNRHVAGFVKDPIEQAQPVLRSLGRTVASVLRPVKKPKGCFAGSTGADYHLDAALIALEPAAGQVVEGVHLLGELGDLLQPDQKGLEPLGRRVTGVGSSLGLRTGIIMACAYEWDPQPEDETVEYSLCDYLLMGAEDGSWPDEKTEKPVAKGKAGRPFAVPGDSGMLVVTQDGHRPVALLWGGQKQSFWNAAAQEGWAYATSISAVMEVLKIEALKPH